MAWALALVVEDAETASATDAADPVVTVAVVVASPVVVVALSREEAVPHLRGTMGATDSRKAEAGTIRNLHGTDIERNAIHGSDSPENAAKEIAFFFSEAELI